MTCKSSSCIQAQQLQHLAVRNLNIGVVTQELVHAAYVAEACGCVHIRVSCVRHPNVHAGQHTKDQWSITALVDTVDTEQSNVKVAF